MLPSSNIQSIIGATLFGADDTKIGRITTVLVDAADGHPTFAEVHTGFLGHATRLVPLDDARWERDDVYVSYSAAIVKDAPRHEADGGVTPEQEDELRRHYAGEAQDARADATPAATAGGPAAREAADRDADRDHDDRAAALQRDHDADRNERAHDSGTDRDRDHRDSDGDRDHTPEHAAGDVPPVPDIEEGQVLREERLVVRREEVPVDDDSSARHAVAPGDTPRI